MDLRARILAKTEGIPPGSLVPIEWVRGLVDDAGQDDVDLTVAEAGALLGRAESTIRTMCADGRLEGSYRLNHREWRVPRSALRALRNGAPPDEEPAPIDADLAGWRRVERKEAG